MKRVFGAYQYIGPAIFTPLAALLWWHHYDGHLYLVGIALAVPILHGYVVPAIGTNVLGMWAFKTRFRLGHFRPHHGFVFGSATAMLVLLVIGPPDPAPTAVTIAVTAAKVGLLLLAVNWIYDALALRAGILEVYNQPWAEGAGPLAVTADYVFWFFGAFGLIFGAGLRFAESILHDEPTLLLTMLIGSAITASTILLPSLGYVITSWLRHGHSGLHPFNRPGMEVSKR